MTKRSFEDLVTAGLELGRVEAQARWEFGKLFEHIPDEFLKDYAEQVGLEYETLKCCRNESAQTRLKF